MKQASSDLSDAKWAKLEGILKELLSSRRGQKAQNNRAIINGILWAHKEGATWRQVPERYGKWQTIYRRFNRWQRGGVWKKIWEELMKAEKEAEETAAKLRPTLDSSIAPVHPDATGAKKKYF